MNDLTDNNSIELTIYGVTSEGRGVGRLDGMAVFVAGALPGERVRACVTSRKKRYATGHTVEVLEPAAGRAVPSCPYYDTCGGCSLQHTDYQTELELKRQIVSQNLLRLGGQEIDVPLPLAAASAQAYRNRAVFHYDGRQLGYYNESSHRLTPVDSCELLLPPLNRLLSQMREALPAAGLPELRAVAMRCSADGARLLLTFICRRPGVAEWLAAALMPAVPGLTGIWENSGPPIYGQYGETWRLLQGEEKLSDSVGPVRLALSPGSFLQVNPGQTTVLYDLIRRFAGLDGSQSVLDLYSGVGSIALYLSGRARLVWGVESYGPAVADAAANAALNAAANCRFFAARAEDILPRWAAQGRRFDVAVLDPPRAGCDRRLLQAVGEMAPPRLVYVSCAPATLARDLKALTELGYVTEQLQPVDMFPRTCHVETVCLLTHKG
ncbi:MAG: 23S rRNA (uracil(1939)-C(5))-methyltransferase RlmD [Firmicutes bacterium]|nr:23S rRNA (uracil(1939)-C(5))-methyltransferase RlmD [Bacillota bacterium]